jgi:hypothetical protein
LLLTSPLAVIWSCRLPGFPWLWQRMGDHGGGHPGKISTVELESWDRPTRPLGSRALRGAALFGAA